MNEEEKRSALSEKIALRIKEDEKWGKRDFLCAQVFTWLAILASFLAAILAASDKVEALVLAFLAAVPGTVIVIEKSFNFARRARWHFEMAVGLDELLNDIKFGEKTIPDIAQKLGKFRRDMEARFPPMSVEGLGDAPPKV